ncbi:MAG TPA: hypothetical protein VN317_10865 [Candidatus Methanoperedens sp.]|nr:hypothetical protein [Candidatus Methanoperedens sp.]
MAPAGSSGSVHEAGACAPPRVCRQLRAFLALALFSSIFAALTSPSLDSEFWWHLASGRWIWENHRLMSADPFDCTSAVFGASGQQRYQLTQSWLAQVLLHGAYQLGGPAGASLLRALVFTALLVALGRLLRRAGAGPALSALLVGLAFVAIVQELQYVENRPQMWSSLFFVVHLLILENLREGRRWARIALPLLMLLWANLHGGYILGVAVLAIAVAAALLGRHPERRRILLAAGAAIALTGANPAGYDLLLAYPRWRLANPLGIFEDQSLFTYFTPATLAENRPALTAVFLLPFITLLPRLRSLPRARLDVLAIHLIALAMGLKAQRFLVFLVPTACWMTALNVAAWRDGALRSKLLAPVRRAPPWVASALAAVVVLSLAAWCARSAFQTSALRPGASVRHPAEGAAAYLVRSGLQGNVFNEYSLGGYLAWRLPAAMKVFIYGRMAYPELLALYEDVVNSPRKSVSLASGGGLRYFYNDVFDRFAINAVVTPAANGLSGDVNSLALALEQDRAWALVHAEPSALVFLRVTAAPPALLGKALPKGAVFEAMIAVARAAGRTGHGRMSPVWRRTVALAHLGSGRREEAVRRFDEYLALVPRDDWARGMRATAAGDAPGR